MVGMDTDANLAPYAMDVRRSRGRRHSEPLHPYRNDYARDRDRVVHSRAFRRLEAKTQVFTMRFSDHFRNRLTHTLEVAQIARTVAGALQLNSDLVEALALAHESAPAQIRGTDGKPTAREVLRDSKLSFVVGSTKFDGLLPPVPETSTKSISFWFARYLASTEHRQRHLSDGRGCGLPSRPMEPPQ